MRTGESTIAARLTAPGPSAIATIGIAGPRALALVEGLFVPRAARPLAHRPIDEIAVGRWGSPVGEEVVVARRAADSLEIHCHGGSVAAQAILDSLAARGATIVDWNCWISRHTGDQLAAEALIALAQAATERSAAILLDQYRGALRRSLVAIVADLESGRHDAARQQVDQLLGHAALGLHLTQPFQIALIGAPNAGKSSLLNALVGFDRAIVWHQPGTTRDVVSAPTAIDGWPCVLLDTAGIRDTTQPLEMAGIDQARRVAERADLVVLCVAKDEPWTSLHNALLHEYPKALVVGTKDDLAGEGTRLAMRTSAVARTGIDALLAAISSRLVPDVPPRGAAVPFAVPQVSALRQARHLIDQRQPDVAADCLQALLAPPR
jgi:tRNA modification GTPase